MKWILILLMFQKGYAGGAISTAEFDTRDACIVAGTAVVETDWANTKAFCYPSSEIDLDTTLPLTPIEIP